MTTKPDVMHLIHRASQSAERVFLLSAAEITPRQYAMLAAIEAHPVEGPTQTALVEATGIDRSTTADVVARLLKRGLVRRLRARQDARAWRVFLTDAGRDALNAGRAAAAEVEASISGLLGATGRAQLVRGLNHIAALQPPAPEARA